MNKGINKQYEYLGLADRSKYDYKDKETNVTNNMIYMFNRSLIMFKYHNLPDTIPYRELERLLQTTGFACITEVNGNLYAFYGGLGGVPDEYYRPTEIIVNNPYLKFNKSLKIDTDCVFMRNDSNCMGLTPLYAKYCTQLSEAEITLILALVNKRIQSFITASDDTTKVSAENFIKDIYAGKLGIIGTNQLFDSFQSQDNNSKSDKTLTEIYEIIKNIKGDLFNEIGLASYNTAKKERVSNAELELNSDNLYPLIDDMLENRRVAVEKINDMYGTNIEVELNSSWDYRAYNGMSIHNTKEETSYEEMEESTEETEETEEHTEETEEHTEDDAKDTES